MINGNKCIHVYPMSWYPVTISLFSMRALHL